MILYLGFADCVHVNGRCISKHDQDFQPGDHVEFIRRQYQRLRNRKAGTTSIFILKGQMMLNFISWVTL